MGIKEEMAKHPGRFRVEDAKKHGYPGGKVTVRKSNGKVVAKGAIEQKSSPKASKKKTGKK